MRSEPDSMRRLPVLFWSLWPICPTTWRRFARCSTCIGVGSHIVVGSRYMKGGRLIGGPWFKQLLSRLSGLTLCWFRGIPTHDATNAFKIYDRGMLSAIRIESKGGFELSLEITVKAFLAGYTITETPATWRDRTAGTSNFKLWQWLPHYLKWYFMAFQPKARSRGAREELRSTRVL